MLTISDIAKQHDRWLGMALSCGACTEDAEDAVQDAYCRIMNLAKERGGYEWIEYKEGEPNIGYIYLTINSCVKDIMRKESKYEDLPEQIGTEPIDTIDEDQYHEYTECIYCALKELQDLSWYDVKLFQAYIGNGQNEAKLSRETDIGKFSIRNTLRNVRQQIKDLCGTPETWTTLKEK